MASLIAPILGSVLPGLAGLFGGGKQQEVKSNQTTNQQQNQNYSNTSTTNPILNPFQQTLAGLFTKGATDLWNQSNNLGGYTQGGLQQIQGQGAANAKTIANNLASRGLSFSPAAATQMTSNTLNSGNQMNSFLQGVPLLQRQLQQQSLQQLMQAFGAMPFGATSSGSGESAATGTSTMSGTNVQNGNPMGGLFSGLSSGLLSPAGNSGYSNIGAILKGIGIG